MGRSTWDLLGNGSAPDSTETAQAALATIVATVPLEEMHQVRAVFASADVLRLQLLLESAHGPLSSFAP